MLVQVYVFFEAIESYRKALGAKVEMLMRCGSKWPSARLGNIEVRPIEEALSVERRYG